MPLRSLLRLNSDYLDDVSQDQNPLINQGKLKLSSGLNIPQQLRDSLTQINEENGQGTSPSEFRLPELPGRKLNPVNKSDYDSFPNKVNSNPAMSTFSRNNPGVYEGGGTTNSNITKIFNT